MAWKLHLACTMSTPLAPPDDSGHAPQQVVKVRRDYNSWVATETMEDYALRYTPQRFRKWSEWRVANTAFGAASFLILEAVGVCRKIPSARIIRVKADELETWLLGTTTSMLGTSGQLPRTEITPREGV